LAIPPTALSTFRAKSAHAINDEADYQKQANPAATDDRPAKVKPAAAEHKKKNNYK